MVPFCSGGCRSSSRQNSPGRSLGRRHSPTSEGYKPGALRISKGSPQLGEGEERRTPPQLRGRQARAPSAATSKGARRGPPALHLSRGAATTRGRPGLPCPAPLPVSLTRCQHGEKQPPPCRELGSAAPRSSLHPPAAPGSPRRRHLPSPSASSAAATHRRRRKPFCTGGRTDTLWWGGGGSGS